MRGALAVALREIVERRLLFFGAFVAGLLPLGLPLLPSLRGKEHVARSVAMFLLVSGIAVVLPLVLGATVLAGEIAQKRLGFYFSRPLSAASIWAGKLLGALAISIGCVLFAGAPVFFLEGDRAFFLATGGLDPRALAALAFPGVFLLLLLAHVGASLARLRSAWIVLDLLLAALFAPAIALSLRSLFFAGLRSSREACPARSLWLLPAAFIAILLAASCVQIVDGRTDARRSHGALSATLWALAAVFTAILGGLAWWRAGGG